MEIRKRNTYAQNEIEKCSHYLKVLEYLQAIEQAIKFYKNTVKPLLFPSNPESESYINRGKVYILTGDFKLALINMKKRLKNSQKIQIK